MATTIKDIARTLNISVSTVSYALNGGPRSVPTRVREDVKRVARELGYRPNRLARSLITGRTSTIGVIPSNQQADLLLTPYLQTALNGVMNACEDLEQDVLVFTRCDQMEVEKIADSLFDGRVDGLIFVAMPPNSKLLELVRQHGIPFATISTAEAEDALQFGCDNLQGVRLAIEHLVSLGHRKIGHISGLQSLMDAQLRLSAFHELVQEFGLELREEWVRCGSFLRHKGERAATEILQLEDRPTALFCANDEMAMGASIAAAKLGLSVPHDVSVVGFDDTPLASAVTPSITTVRQPIAELAMLATHALVSLVKGEEDVSAQSLPNYLVVRSSTAPPPPSR